MNPAEFTSTYYIDRRGSYSRKWDGQHLKFNRTDLLPLWVADMDFMPPKCVQEAICNYVKANPLGYTMTNPKYLEAVIDWYKRRHNCILSKDWLTSAPNVITGIMWCIAASQKQMIPSQSSRPYMEHLMRVPAMLSALLLQSL